jgi:hypothetical protein
MADQSLLNRLKACEARAHVKPVRLVLTHPNGWDPWKELQPKPAPGGANLADQAADARRFSADRKR